MSTCMACDCDTTDGCTPALAFLAGIAFAFQFSTEAMEQRICPRHAEALSRQYVSALQFVPPEERRVRGPEEREG
jgi:hypothetical protein